MKILVDMVLHKITWPLLMMRGWGIEILGYDPSEVIVELPRVVSQPLTVECNAVLIANIY